jgi:hypothetical protein
MFDEIDVNGFFSQFMSEATHSKTTKTPSEGNNILSLRISMWVVFLIRWNLELHYRGVSQVKVQFPMSRLVKVLFLCHFYKHFFF